MCGTFPYRSFHTLLSYSQVSDLYLRLVSSATRTMTKQSHITGAMMGYSQVGVGGGWGMYEHMSSWLLL